MLLQIKVCEFNKSSYPSASVDSVLNTFHQEMRTLLKYVKPSMIKVGNLNDGLFIDKPLKS